MLCDLRADSTLAIGMCLFEGLSAALVATRSIRTLRARAVGQENKFDWSLQKGRFEYLVFEQSALLCGGKVLPTID
jgi:hypothetical protein